MKVKQVLSALELFAPLPLQEDWDNAGLQIGLTEAEVSGALLCLDVTESIIAEATELGCNLVVSHHPLLFRGLKQIADADSVQRTVRMAIERGIAVVSMHTNLDNAPGGVNFKIAEKLGLMELKPLLPKSAAGVGGCSAVVGRLPQPMVSFDFIQAVKKAFDVNCAQCNALLLRPVNTVAICGGAGDMALGEAIKAGADAFITGEMHYHQYFGHEQEIQICVIGHYQSEQYTTEILRSVIARECPTLPLHIAKTNTNPILYI